MRLATRQRTGGEPLKAVEIESLATESTAKTVVTEWLRLTPPVSDVLALVPSLTTPADAEARAYANQLSREDRTTLWVGLDRSGATSRSLKAIANASDGLTVEAVRHIRRRVEEERQQAKRGDIVKRLLDVPLRQGASHAEACDLAVYLLDTEYTGDAVYAADLVIHAGGAARGYTDKLRTRFQAVEDRNDAVFSKSRKQGLVDVNLLRPKKGVLDRLLGR